MRKKIGIVVDSAASLPSGAADSGGIYIVPMTLTLDGVTYIDGQDIAPTAFYRLLRASSAAATTAAPSSGRYSEVFHAAASSHDAIVCITTGGRFSASLDTATTAAAELRTALPELRIRILDSQAAAGSQGLAALAAWRAAQSGASMDACVAAAECVIERVQLLAFVDTLRYLRRSGRVPAIAHAGASLLRIKPLFRLADGEVATIARPRTQRSAIRRLLEQMRRDASDGTLHATVMHADAPALAEILRQHIAADFQYAELFVSEFTPVMGAHIGPGMLGVAYWSESDISSGQHKAV